MTPNEDLKYFKSLQTAVSRSPKSIAKTMADTFTKRVRNDTLKQSFHPPGAFYRAPIGRPPAYASGALSRSVRASAAVGGATFAYANVNVYSQYGALQEWGGFTWGNHGLMRWTNDAGKWFMNDVRIPEHPYMRPTLEAVIRDGSLQRSAIDSFLRNIGTLYP